MYRSGLRLRILSVLFCLTILTGCAILRWKVSEVKVPPLAALDPIYELPTISLAEKEAVLFDAIKARHLNEQGYLLYLSFLPAVSQLG